MPGLVDANQKVRKRKRDEDNVVTRVVSKNYDLTRIAFLEEQILGSRKHYNAIPTLIGYAKCYEEDPVRHHHAVLALCRIFCRLMATGGMIRVKATAKEEEVIARWLRERYQDYQRILLDMLASTKIGRQGIAMTLLMQLVKEEGTYSKTNSEPGWDSGLFASVVQQMVTGVSNNSVREDFVRAFVEVYDDIRFYTYKVLSYVERIAI